ncbi:MAG: hypothetical protein LUO96_00600, partial [Methanomicrobiales archaeon]|nr:hypothetical protein [Methanomicrobiales archaeon]
PVNGNHVDTHRRDARRIPAGDSHGRDEIMVAVREVSSETDLEQRRLLPKGAGVERRSVSGVATAIRRGATGATQEQDDDDSESRNPPASSFRGKPIHRRGGSPPDEGLRQNRARCLKRRVNYIFNLLKAFAQRVKRAPSSPNKGDWFISSIS